MTRTLPLLTVPQDHNLLVVDRDRGCMEGGEMPRYLFIVARGRSDVYADLKHQFLGNPEVEILIDRRQSERRQHQESHAPERRRSERRGQRGGSSHVRGIGGDPGLPALIVELEPGAASSAGAG